MLTYVINTSENKTFDSDKLFDLSGYNKIRWINCGLGQMDKCARHIFEKQNILGSDRFRIAVLIDFFEFDRIRLPYGRNGFLDEHGVDLSLYIPYIEAYLNDNLIVYLERKELFPESFEVYYVQNERIERYQFLDNMETQLKEVLHGREDTVGEILPSAYPFKKLTFKAVNEIADNNGVMLGAKLTGKSTEEEIQTAIDEIREAVGDIKIPRVENIEDEMSPEEAARFVEENTPYGSYTLYCSPTVSLNFNISDYPYGEMGVKMTFSEFFRAFMERVSKKFSIRRHFYLTSYGGGAARVAFDTLSLSLYLIRMYEREEEIKEEGEFEISRLDAAVLKDVLVNAWNKIRAAQEVAKDNRSQYFSLRLNVEGVMDDLEIEKIDEEHAVRKEYQDLRDQKYAEHMSADDYYKGVCKYFYCSKDELDEENRHEMEEIMYAYLRNRDETREDNTASEFAELKNANMLYMTDQCPSREEFNYLVHQKETQISRLFDQTLKAEYLSVDYTEEKKRADQAYNEYNKAKACMSKNIIGDIIFLILTVAAMVIPYYLLQLNAYDSTWLGTTALMVLSSAMFGGIFILAFLLQIIPVVRRMKHAKTNLRRCLRMCKAKHSYSFSEIRRRYESDLIRIEKTRYDIRQLRCLHEANKQLEKNVVCHRQMLEEVLQRLSSMLNNLDVEPVFDRNESVEGEFDMSKSFHAKSNKVYHIFSIEVIEKMFPKKGSEKLQ